MARRRVSGFHWSLEGRGEKGAYGEEGCWHGFVEMEIGIPGEDGAADLVAAVCSAGGLALGFLFGWLGRWRGGHGCFLMLM